MEAFLSFISSDTLGIWKALLMPRPAAKGGPNSSPTALSEAATALAQRHFEDLLLSSEGAPSKEGRVVQELLELFILTWGALDQRVEGGVPGEPKGHHPLGEIGLAAALGALFPSTGRLSTRAGQLAALAADLEEQHRNFAGLHHDGDRFPANERVGGEDFREETTVSGFGALRPEVSRRDMSAVTAAAPLPAAVKRTSRLAGLTAKQPQPLATTTVTVEATEAAARGIPVAPSRVSKGRAASARGVDETAAGSSREAKAATAAPTASTASGPAVVPARGRKKAVPEDRRDGGTVTTSSLDVTHTCSRDPSSSSQCLTDVSDGSLAPSKGTACPVPQGGPAVVILPPPVLLVLGPTLHAIPWEAVPGLRAAGAGAGEVYRSPSLALSCLSALGHRTAPLEATHQDGNNRKGSSTSSRSTGSSGRSCIPEVASGGEEARVDLRSTCYALNPGGDLEDTQKCFEEWFGKTLSWQVRAVAFRTRYT